MKRIENLYLFYIIKVNNTTNLHENIVNLVDNTNQTKQYSMFNLCRD